MNHKLLMTFYFLFLGLCRPRTILGPEEKPRPLRRLVERLCRCQCQTIGRLLPMPLRLVRRISLNWLTFSIE